MGIVVRAVLKYDVRAATAWRWSTQQIRVQEAIQERQKRSASPNRAIACFTIFANLPEAAARKRFQPAALR